MNGCSSGSTIPSLEVQTEKLAAAMEKGGYAPSSSLAINSTNDIWTKDGARLEIVMTAPLAPGKYPLIIYLPSLGEDAHAGRLWREAWAKAGYAVFSMQPLAIGQALQELTPEHGTFRQEGQVEQADDEDKDSWEQDNGGKGNKHSRGARSSELRYLGHEYFAIDALKTRLEQLFRTYQQLKDHAVSGQALFAAADFSRVILAGYDLGGQTVAAALGEHFSANLPNNSELKPLAAIILSPSIDMAEGNVRSRFENLNLPLLIITGSDDNDPYAISSASVREAVWEFSPSGGKYLLLLTGDVHQLLAGADMGGRFGLAGGRGGNGLFSWWGSGGSRFAPSANQYGGNNGGGGRHSKRSDGSGGMSNKGNPDLGYKQVAAVLSTTTSFLDKITKNDEFAQFWIDKKANKWLDSAGTIQIR